MRILQVIDSLEIGGAERMAVNYANALLPKIEFSGIVVTRKEGSLKGKVDDKVNYFFLKRKSKLDIKAVLQLRKICKLNKITHLQAHSSSFFIAFLTKIVVPKINIIWHDHNGLSEFISTQKSVVIKIASYFFKGIIVVNDKLKNWAENELNCKNVIYLPNFTSIESATIKSTKLFGNEGKKILCLANLRFQKNHFLLLDVAKKLKLSHPNWSFHLVGKDFNDDYSAKIKQAIVDDNLENTVFVYGSRADTQNIIEQADIAILTSQSEGLPVALLEYGLNRKPVVSTKVGEIPMIIKDGINGCIVDNYDDDAFYISLVKVIEDAAFRAQLGNQLFETIAVNNSEEAVIKHYLNWLKTI